MDIREAKKIFSRIGFGIFVSMLSIQLIQVILALLAARFFSSFTQSAWYSWVLVAVSTYLVGYPLFFLITKKIPTTPPSVKRWATGREFAGYGVVSFAAMYLFNFVSVVLITLIGMLKGGTVSNPLAEVTSGSSVWASLLFGCVGAPVLEELVFRKILIDKLRPFSDAFCVFVSAFIFALFHGNLSQMLYAFALGAIFAYLTIRTGSCRNSIVLHMAVNLFGMILVPGVTGWAAQLLPRLSALVTGVVLLLLLALVVLGVILFFLNRKRLVFSPGTYRLEGSLYGCFFANPGMICYILLAALCVISVLLV